MSEGYKQRCLNDRALAMWSFDGDSFDRTSNVPLTEVVIDELGMNHGKYISNFPSRSQVYLGNKSLVDLEQTRQYSICFGNGTDYPYMDIPEYFPLDLVSVQHSDTFNFWNDNEKRYGSFSVEFLMNKQDDYGMQKLASNLQWRSDWYHCSPLIRKKGVFELNFESTSFGTRIINFNGPLGNINGGTRNYKNNYINLINVTNRTLHIIATYDLQKVDVREWKATQKLYINGRTIGEITKTFYEMSFQTNNTMFPIEFGGFSEKTGGSSLGQYWSDRQTSRLYLDQISIYNYALNEDQVLEHFKKTKDYEGFLTYQDPTILNTFQNSVETNNDDGAKILTQEIGVWTTLVYNNHRLNDVGPNQILSSSSILLSKDAYIWNKYLYYPYNNDKYFSFYSPETWNGIDVNNHTNYTINMWFKCSTNKIATLLNIQTFRPNLIGWNLEINKNINNEYSPGTLLFSEAMNDNNKIDAKGAWSDGNWHMVSIRRKDQTLSIFVDGSLINQKFPTYFDGMYGQPGQIFLFGGPNATSNAGQGNLAYFSVYPYSMTDSQIRALYSYDIVYIVKGNVTLQGNPFGATLRFYDSKSGQLIKEIQSDPITGAYKAVFQTDAALDVLVIDKYDISVKYKTFGPITPSATEDYPITL